MSMGVDKKKRKYFHSSGNGSDTVSSKYKMFLVRYHDEGSNKIENDGPHAKEDEAIAILNGYLKQGICSWLVSYND